MKSFKKLFIVVGCLVFVGLGYYVLREVSPMTASRYPFMLILLAVDAYLWISIRKRILKLPAFPSWSITVLYWLPLAIFVAVYLISFIDGVALLPTPLVTYLTGIVLVTYGAKLITVVFFILHEIYRIIRFSFRFNRAKRQGKPYENGQKTMSRGKFLQNAGLAAGGIFLSGLLIGMIKWARDFRVRTVNLSFPNLPARFHGLKIIQISDLHLGSWASTHPISEVSEMISRMKPDIVFFTGDLVNFASKEAYRFRDILKSIRAREGVYTILGNHDYGDYLSWPDEKSKEENMEKLYRFYDTIGWELLRNEPRILKRGNDRLVIAGVENWSSYSREQKDYHSRFCCLTIPLIGNIRSVTTTLMST